ncbi:ADP-ribosylglycohydrolase family protein [Paenibacillus faecalis]|uniref:ADP-ribosylglycohydrolase family protein n=1 Tax=Paenibacillus faecalis TaxID=2079532 RepID=UPI000D0FFFA6|nr:ADP-ribosylglycohydrolase family protein [Paenibacillus faecalis]
MKNKILGALYGMAIGDSMGMPPELWGRNRVKNVFGTITDFLDGPEENEVARNFKRGQYTDDTSQALLILDALIENDFVPDTQIIGRYLLEWADKLNAFDNNILGPSSKAALLAIKEGKDTTEFTSRAETNGAAMRIAPIGCLFTAKSRGQLPEYVFQISQVTHSTDVAVGGAAMIAAAVSSAMEDRSWDDIMQDAVDAYDVAKGLGAETYSASLSARLKLALTIAEKYENDEEPFLQNIYDVVGSGVMTSESVPAALAIAYYAKEPERCSLLCANLGGDTDTIGAMATAICGAKSGAEAINGDWKRLIDEANDVNLEHYADQIMAFRKK